MIKHLPANAGDAGGEDSIPGLGRSPGGGNSNPLQYSCLENPMDRGAWWFIVYRVAKSQTRLNTHTHSKKSTNIWSVLDLPPFSRRYGITQMIWSVPEKVRMQNTSV